MPAANGEPLEAERIALEKALATLAPGADTEAMAELVPLLIAAYPTDVVRRDTAVKRACAAAGWKGPDRKTFDKAIADGARTARHRAAAEHGSDPALRLANRMLDKYEGRLLYDGEFFRSYIGTHWQAMSYKRVQDEIIELGTIDGARQNRNGQLSALPHLMEGALKLLEPLAFKNVPATVRDLRRVLINVENGTLEFERGSWTPTLRAHNPDDALFHMLNVAYEPKAACPNYDKLVREIFARTFYTLTDNDEEHDTIYKLLKHVGAESFETRHTFGGIEFSTAKEWAGRTGWIEGGEVRIVDVEENVRLYEEMAGYAMTGYRGFNKFVLFHGRAGVNGKSVLSRLIKEFVPEEAIQAIPDLADFRKNRFAFAQLRNKLLVICDDMNRTRLDRHSGFIKQLSWNTDLSSDVKHSREFSNFPNTALLFLIGNHMGSSEGLDRAFFDRVLLFDFNMVFQRDDSVWENAVFNQPSEMAGVFLRFVAGLGRAMRRGTIETTRAVRYAISRWIADYDFFEAHLEECSTTSRTAAGVHGNNDGSTMTEFHNSFLIYWREQRRAGDPPTFGMYLKTLRGKSQYTIGDSGHRGLYLKGRWLRPDKEFPFAMDNSGQNVFPFQTPRERERERERRLAEREEAEKRQRAEREAREKQRDERDEL